MIEQIYVMNLAPDTFYNYNEIPSCCSLVNVSLIRSNHPSNLELTLWMPQSRKQRSPGQSRSVLQSCACPEMDQRNPSINRGSQQKTRQGFESFIDCCYSFCLEIQHHHNFEIRKMVRLFQKLV